MLMTRLMLIKTMSFILSIESITLFKRWTKTSGSWSTNERSTSRRKDLRNQTQLQSLHLGAKRASLISKEISWPNFTALILRASMKINQTWQKHSTALQLETLTKQMKAPLSMSTPGLCRWQHISLKHSRTQLLEKAARARSPSQWWDRPATQD